MKKVIRVIFFISLIILVLISNTSVSAYADVNYKIRQNPFRIETDKYTFSDFSGNSNLGPGDEITYVVNVKNETSAEIDLYFKGAEDIINSNSLEKIIFEVFINEDLCASRTI